ncbi:unnamed protein product [Rodentolepis nana]|uniref:Pecanex-like protein n=1 Tax=Rodentolepis nana TaxID=102285 RepID=A0A0R3TYI8_RODNA|nr:unnamed protein product [Rodentolepis nana]
MHAYLGENIIMQKCSVTTLAMSSDTSQSTTVLFNNTGSESEQRAMSQGSSDSDEKNSRTRPTRRRDDGNALGPSRRRERRHSRSVVRISRARASPLPQLSSRDRFRPAALVLYRVIHLILPVLRDISVDHQVSTVLLKTFLGVTIDFLCLIRSHVHREEDGEDGN